LDLDLDLTFDTTSVNSSFGQPSLDSTTSVEAFFLRSTFATLTGSDTPRTPKEEETEKKEATGSDQQQLYKS